MAESQLPLASRTLLGTSRRELAALKRKQQRGWRVCGHWSGQTKVYKQTNCLQQKCLQQQKEKSWRERQEFGFKSIGKIGLSSKSQADYGERADGRRKLLNGKNTRRRVVE